MTAYNYVGFIVFQRNRRTSRSELNDVQHTTARNPLIVVSTVPDPTEVIVSMVLDPTEVIVGGGRTDAKAQEALGDDHDTCGTLKSPEALEVHRTNSSASASTDMSDVHLDVSPRATSSRCGDHDDDDDAQRVSSTVFTFDINVDDQSDYDV